MIRGFTTTSGITLNVSSFQTVSFDRQQSDPSRYGPRDLKVDNMTTPAHQCTSLAPGTVLPNDTVAGSLKEKEKEGSLLEPLLLLRPPSFVHTVALFLREGDLLKSENTLCPSAPT